MTDDRDTPGLILGLDDQISTIEAPRECLYDHEGRSTTDRKESRHETDRARDLFSVDGSHFRLFRGPSGAGRDGAWTDYRLDFSDGSLFKSW